MTALLHRKCWCGLFCGYAPDLGRSPRIRSTVTGRAEPFHTSDGRAATAFPTAAVVVRFRWKLSGQVWRLAQLEDSLLAHSHPRCNSNGSFSQYVASLDFRGELSVACGACGGGDDGECLGARCALTASVLTSGLGLPHSHSWYARKLLHRRAACKRRPRIDFLRLF